VRWDWAKKMEEFEGRGLVRGVGCDWNSIEGSKA